MPLVTCPDCKQQISDRALACPNCGCPRGKPSGLNMIWILALLLGTFLLGIGALIAVNFYSINNP